MIESLASKAAEALAPELVKLGTRKLGYEILGTPAQRGMEAVYTRAIKSMLLEMARSSGERVDPEIVNVAATVFQDLLKDEEIAGRLLGVALRAEPVPAEDLHESATSLGYEPETLTFDFDDAIEVLCNRIWDELLAEARKEGTRIQAVINEELLISIRGLHHGTAYRSANQDHSRTAPASATPEEVEAALAKLDTLPLQELPKRRALPQGSVMPLRPNPHFVGRTQDLKQIAKDLKGGRSTALGEITVRASSDLGGIGKSQLASEFVHRYGAYFHSVYWLNFGDPAGVPAEVAACGGSGGMQLGPEFHNLPMEERVSAVFARFQSELPRLLVFDNCDDEELLHQWLPVSGASRVLVTSRRENWDPVLGVTSHQVNLLDRGGSIELLRKYRPDLPEVVPELDAIAAELGDLPLALDLAGRYLARYHHEVTPTDYLQELRQPELLEHPLLRKARGISPTRHDMDVWRTFAVSYRRLDASDETDSLALVLLARTAHLAAGEPIPEYLAAWTLAPPGSRDTPPQPETAFREAVDRLENLGLLQTMGDGEVSMHRLVAAFAAVEATDAEARAAVEDTCARAAGRAQRLGQPARQERLLPHLRHLTNASWRRSDDEAGYLWAALSLGLDQLEEYDEAVLYAERAWRISYDLYSSDDRNTLQRRSNIGALYESKGDREQARTIYEEALRAQKRRYGPYDPDVAATLNNLGASFARDGLYHETLARYRGALEIREAIWANTRADHPNRQEHAYRVAESNSNMGALLMDLGRVREAGPHLDRALRIMGEEFGEAHERNAGTRLTRARALLALVEHVEALEDLGRVLDTHHKVSSGVPEQAAMAMALRGTIFAAGAEDETLDEANRTMLLEQADTWLDLALKAAGDGYGEQHPVTGALHRVLGSIKEAQGAPDDTRDHREKAESCRRYNMKGTDLRAASTMQAAGSTLMSWGLYDEAQVYLEGALNLRANVAGEQDFETSKTLCQLGVLFQLQGNDAQARQYFERALSARAQTCGAEHPATRIVRENLGTT